MPKINRRESAALINSLSAGVVPRIGLRHIAVGRAKEVNAFLSDLETVAEGGAAFRFICGRYGSGKSFLLQMIRANAMDQQFVVMDADLSPERRLTGTQRQGAATYRELMQHLATKVRPEGGALESILQKWITQLQMMTARSLNLGLQDPALVQQVDTAIAAQLLDLTEMTAGYSFVQVISAYYRGMKEGDDQLKQHALRWLKGEYNTKTEARKDLPVDTIINDQNWYDFLKLFARFVTKAGYKGCLIFLDEGVNLYKITHRQARESNYEKLLTIFNDTMQGKAHHIGFFMSGTPQFIYDEKRGLFSYGALKSRLALNQFARDGFVDYAGPVITLATLSPEELYLLLERLCEIHGAYYNYDCQLSSSQLSAFLNHVLNRMGADELLTPREVTRDFLGLLNVLHQDPTQSFGDLIADGSYEVKSAQVNPEEDDLFAGFSL